MLEAPMVDGRLTFDGNTAYQVKFVACIRETEEHSTNMTLAVEDGTGTVSVKFFIDEAEADSVTLRRAKWV